LKVFLRSKRFDLACKKTVQNTKVFVTSTVRNLESMFSVLAKEKNAAAFWLMNSAAERKALA